MSIQQSYDTSIFIEQAIHEVYNTLFIAIGLVVAVIFTFLGNPRATLIPVLAVPVSIMSTFIVLSALGYSINLLTLLALVLAIGLVVDDAIVVIENIVRRMHEHGETPLVAAYRGTRQVGFAVVTTTMVLIAVFAPISFLQGDVGRLFSEFAIAMAAAVFFSGIVALTLTPMLASKLLKGEGRGHGEKGLFGRIRRRYRGLLGRLLRLPLLVMGGFAAIVVVMGLLFLSIPKEYTPKEDRGAFMISVNGPEGASFAYMQQYMDEIERRLMPYVEKGEIQRLIVRAPRGYGNTASFNTGSVLCSLADWGKRRSAWAIMDEVRGKLADLPGVRAFPIMRQGFAGSTAKPVQFVIGGGTYEELVKWRDIMLAKINAHNPGLVGIDWSYKETKPQIEVNIDYIRASELGVTVSDIGRTLETVLGSRNVTTYIDRGKEYDVMVQGERADTRTIGSLENLYVRSKRSGELIPLSNLVTVDEIADSSTLTRYNRVRAITLEASLASGYTLGEALTYLEKTARANLPENAIIDYKGQSQDFKESGSSIYFVFALGVAVMFLVMAAQFESFVQPFIIIFTVPLAMTGALLGLWLTGGSLNIFTQIGLIMLVGLAAKNGILIVEFTNQLRGEGKGLMDALQEACELRLRPILMTSITAAAGAVPLILSHGAGSETRAVVGVVIFAGVLAATFFTLFVVPVVYSLLARKSGSPGDVRRRLEQEMENVPDEESHAAGH
jgi:multidrug efflux pump